MSYLTDLIRRRAELAPERIALEDGFTGKSWSYAVFEANIAQTAGMLHGLGIGAGDRVALLCRNRVEFFELLFACARLGAICLPLNWRSPALELAPLLGEAAPKLLFFGAEDEAVGRELALAFDTLTAIGLDEPGLAGHAQRQASSPALRGREHWPEDDIWYLLYTSGTTGKPKAVIQTYRMAMVNAFHVSQAVQLRRDDVTVSFLPLFHTAGINLYTLPALICGAKVILLAHFDVSIILDFLDRRRVSLFFGVPSVYQMLSLDAGFGSTDLSSVRHWACGGAPLPDPLVSRYSARNIRVCNGFGMTETGPTAFLMDEEHVTDKVGSVGKLQILTESRIVLPNGQEAGVDEVGELWMRGPGLTPGYWQQPTATRAAITPEGWLKSGDLARRDKDGYFYISGRIKDMYISGGENVYPAEVENVLASFPGVFEAAVLGVPDLVWGEVGHAFVQMHGGMPFDAEALSSFCRQRLAAYKVPRRFTPVEELPRTPSGKVQKHILSPLQAQPVAT
jgi:fatty-acyl-CoA synthase